MKKDGAVLSSQSGRRFLRWLFLALALICAMLLAGCFDDIKQGNEGGGGGAAPRNIVFATSTLQDGNLGGLAGADAICNTRASAAGLPGAYVAWLSSTTVDARDRLARPGAGCARTGCLSRTRSPT